MRDGGIAYEVRRARRDAEQMDQQPMSATAAAIGLVLCALGLLLIVVGVRVAKDWGWLA